MFRLLVATHNPAKLQEIRKYLKIFLPHVEIVSLTDIQINTQPEEAGKTFQENAELKARYYAKLTNLPTISDDGGLMIDALNGEPGVLSSRWLGRKATDKELISHCLKKMAYVPKGKRAARFETCLYFFNPQDSKDVSAIGFVAGTIATTSSPKVIHGYPYRSIFIVTELNKMYADLNEEEQVKINHRYAALRNLVKKLKSCYHIRN